MKKHAWNRLLATFLTIAMFISMWAAPVSAKTFSDTERHWAADLIDKWSDYNLLEGIGNNLFEPDRPMTIGEVSKVISVLMGYSTAAENKFTDVTKGAWYEQYILRMVAAKLLPDSGSVTPERAIQRGEAFAILAKAFELAPKSGETTFADNAAIPAEQKPYIKALQDAGVLNGKPVNGALVAAVNDSLTRSELMKMFDGMAGDLLYKAGDYQKNYDGNLVINATGVKLSGSTIGGNLYIAEGVGNGDVYLTDVTVKGTIFVKGGGANSFYASNVKAGRIVLDHSGLSAKFSGNSFTSGLEVRQNASVSYDGTKSYKLADRFVVVQNEGAGQTITLSNVNAAVLENNGNDTVLKGTAKFDKAEGNGKFSKDSSVVIGTTSSSGGGSSSSQDKTITILSFNDFHGALDQSVSTSNPGADKFVGFTKNEIAKDPNNTLLLVAGDNYQGSALSNLNLGKPVTDMIKSLGSKYSAIGNHEFDWGSANLNTWAQEGNFQFLCANIIDTVTGNVPDFCQPYAVTTVNGVKIGIIGFITRETPTLVKAANVAGLEFRDPAPIATELAAKLRTEEKCDIVIALTHLGATQSTLNTGEIKGEAAKLAADIQPGTLDAIISGHTHTKVAGTVNGTPIVQGYYNGRGLGKLQFTLSNGVLKSVIPSYMDVDPKYDKPDAEMTAKIADYNAKLAPTLNEVVGVGGPFETKDDLADWAGNLIFNYVKRTTNNDYVVLQNDGGWRKGTFGEDSPKYNRVTMGYLFTLMPFDNEIVLIDKMKGADLLEILTQKKADGTAIEFTSKPDINGAKKIGDDWYLADGTTKIEATGEYKVICNDFMLTGGDKYSQFIPYSADPSSFRFIGTPLRDAMADQLKHEAEQDKNITVLSFNDFHGALDQSVSTSNPGADKFVGFTKNEIAKDPNNTLLLVAGDNYQGSALSNLNLGKPVTDMIKSLGSKYSAIGNHEFDWGSANLNTWAQEGNFQFLCANIIDTVTGNVPDFCQPYAVTTVNGVKIGIIGFITRETPTLVKAANVAGLEFRDPAPIATELAAKLRTEEKCDIVIALTHLGATQSTLNTGEIKGEAAKLATEIQPGTLDAIISGHTHTKVAGTVNGTPIVQGYYNGRGLGKMQFTLSISPNIWMVPVL